MSIYGLKPRFQALLRPSVGALFRAGITANQVTLAACVISLGIGLGLFLRPIPRAYFVLIPVWMLLRMGLNAVDGMLAREHGQKSNLGAFLNEQTDVISDAALYLPFAAVPPFSPLWVGVVIILAALSEMSGVLGQIVGASRRYDGPMGKSDRAFVFGALGLYVALDAPMPAWAGVLMPVLAALIVWTIINRTRRALAEATSVTHRSST